MSKPKLIKLEKYFDNRGYFADILSKKLSSALNFEGSFLNYQISISFNKKNVIRGLHFQSPLQTKLVFLLKGKIQDIVVDIDKKSKTFGKYYEFILKEKENLLYIPKKFAHGFCALEESEIIYILDKNYNNKKQNTIKWNDEDLNIRWMSKKPIISKKDKNNLTFKEYKKKFHEKN